MSELKELYESLHIVCARLDTLTSIDAANILIPGGPQARYQEIIEGAGAALGQVETVVDTCASICDTNTAAWTRLETLHSKRRSRNSSKTKIPEDS